MDQLDLFTPPRPAVRTRKPEGKTVYPVVDAVVRRRFGADVDPLETWVSVTGKPGRYSVLVGDDDRDPETAYSSPMPKHITTADPLELLYAALAQYLTWKETR